MGSPQHAPAHRAPAGGPGRRGLAEGPGGCLAAGHLRSDPSGVFTEEETGGQPGSVMLRGTELGKDVIRDRGLTCHQGPPGQLQSRCEGRCQAPCLCHCCRGFVAGRPEHLTGVALHSEPVTEEDAPESLLGRSLPSPTLLPTLGQQSPRDGPEGASPLGAQPTPALPCGVQGELRAEHSPLGRVLHGGRGLLLSTLSQTSLCPLCQGTTWTRMQGRLGRSGQAPVPLWGLTWQPGRTRALDPARVFWKMGAPGGVGRS